MSFVLCVCYHCLAFSMNYIVLFIIRTLVPMIIRREHSQICYASMSSLDVLFIIKNHPIKQTYLNTDDFCSVYINLVVFAILNCHDYWTFVYATALDMHNSFLGGDGWGVSISPLCLQLTIYILFMFLYMLFSLFHYFLLCESFVFAIRLPWNKLFLISIRILFTYLDIFLRCLKMSDNILSMY